jgi:hypothetical protein
MSAQVISFHHAKARHIAIAKAARVREIAEELACWGQSERHNIVRTYLLRGWATDNELRLALESLEEVGR